MPMKWGKVKNKDNFNDSQTLICVITLHYKDNIKILKFLTR